VLSRRLHEKTKLTNQQRKYIPLPYTLKEKKEVPRLGYISMVDLNLGRWSGFN